MPDIDRMDALALISEQQFPEILKMATASSMAMSTFRTRPLSKKIQRIPVLATKPVAKFVDESASAPAGVKPTSEVTWAGRNLVVEEMAVIVPVHENVIADADYDLWGEIKPELAEAIGITLDAAVFFGQPGLTAVGGGTYPSSWPAALVPAAVAAGNAVSAAAPGDLYDDLNATEELVAQDGYPVNRVWCDDLFKYRLRGLRDTTGRPMYDTLTDGASILMNNPMSRQTNGSWLPSLAPGDNGAHVVFGDASKVHIGIRQDITFSMSNQATLGTGVNQINLWERDMVAIRAVFRAAFTWAAPKTVRGGANPFPFSVYKA